MTVYYSSNREATKLALIVDLFHHRASCKKEAQGLLMPRGIWRVSWEFLADHSRKRLWVSMSLRSRRSPVSHPTICLLP